MRIGAIALIAGCRNRSIGPMMETTPTTCLGGASTGAATEQVLGVLSPRLTVNPFARYFFNSRSSVSGLVIVRSVRCRKCEDLKNLFCSSWLICAKNTLPLAPACNGADKPSSNLVLVTFRLTTWSMTTLCWPIKIEKVTVSPVRSRSFSRTGRTAVKSSKLRR